MQEKSLILVIHAHAEWALKSKHPNKHLYNHRCSHSSHRCLILTWVKFNLKYLNNLASTYHNSQASMYLNNLASMYLSNQASTYLSNQASMYLSNQASMYLSNQASMYLSNQASMYLNSQALTYLNSQALTYLSLKLQHLTYLLNPSNLRTKEPTTI